MPDEIIETGGADAAPAIETSPNTDAPAIAESTPESTSETPPTTETPPVPNDSAVENEFKVPDEYKDKSWASKVKSESDLYKQLDNLSSLAGKKHAYPDADATPEQMDEYFEGLKPESKEAYNFGENHPNPEIAGKYADLLYDAKISPHQAGKLIPAFQALEKQMMEEATTAKGFEELMTAKFGDSYDAVVSNVSESIKANVSKETGEILDGMPNQFLASVYEYGNALTKKHAEEIAALKAEYGAKEGGDNLHGEKSAIADGAVNIEEVRAGIRAELHAINKRPHKESEKQALIAKLDETYK